MRTFLQAEWRHLLMLNYSVDPALLRSYVPAGTELDEWQGTHYLSVVGFLFQNTRVLGWRIPFHVNFEEVNLRFYVRRKTPQGWRRGVVFIREIVPRRVIALVAKFGYNEPYISHPMCHVVDRSPEKITVKYEWFSCGRWHSLGAVTSGPAQMIRENSEEEFITEHYWGYTALKNNRSAEYEVEHPRWEVWPVKNVTFDCDIAHTYGAQFVEALNVPPKFAFLANGSAVTVRMGQKI